MGEARSPLDPSTLARLQALDEQMPDEDVLGNLARVFGEDAGRYLDRIEAASAANNPKGVREAAHALKGAALAVGAQLAAEAARELEHNPEEAREAVPALRAAVTAALTALERTRQGLRA